MHGLGLVGSCKQDVLLLGLLIVSRRIEVPYDTGVVNVQDTLYRPGGRG